MIIKFKDTQTGEEAWSDYPFMIWWWAEGNGACDCNRAALFDHYHKCGDSPYRYQAVDIADDDKQTIEEAMNEFNEDLFENAKLKTKEDVLRVINFGLY